MIASSTADPDDRRSRRRPRLDYLRGGTEPADEGAPDLPGDQDGSAVTGGPDDPGRPGRLRRLPYSASRILRMSGIGGEPWAMTASRCSL